MTSPAVVRGQSVRIASSHYHHSCCRPAQLDLESGKSFRFASYSCQGLAQFSSKFEDSSFAFEDDEENFLDVEWRGLRKTDHCLCGLGFC